MQDLDVSANRFQHLTVTNRRCIFWSQKKDVIAEFDRKALSSIDFICWNVWPIAIAVLFLAMVTGAAAVSIHFLWPIALALAMIGLFLLFDYEVLSFWVSGRAQPVKVSRTRYLWTKRSSSLYGLLRLVRTLSPGRSGAGLDESAR